MSLENAPAQAPAAVPAHRPGLFVVIALAISWPLFVLPLAFGPPGSTGHGYAALVTWSLAMWGPGIAALLLARRPGTSVLETLGLDRLGEARVYLWAWLLPIGLVLLTGLSTWAIGLGQLDLGFPAIAEAMAQAPGGDRLPLGAVVAIQVLIAVTLAPLLNTLLALGEELGWRGYLLPGLITRAGQSKAIVATGVVWGLWHAPAILQGHNFPGHPLLGIGLMVLATTALGAILAWLYLRTGSPWAPALAHGSVNAVAGLPLLFLTGVDMAWGGMLLSLTGTVVMSLFVLWLVVTSRLPVRGTPWHHAEADHLRAVHVLEGEQGPEV